MGQFELVTFSVWTKAKLAETNRTINEWLAQGWKILSVSAATDGNNVYVAFYREDSSSWR